MMDFEMEVSSLKRSGNTLKEWTDRGSKRTGLRMDIEFIGDFDILRAKGVDFSEGGMSLDTSERLPFEMQFELDGERYRRRARLVWVRRLPDGGYRFGLEFVPSEPYSTI